jgi:hypothetical protein
MTEPTIRAAWLDDERPAPDDWTHYTTAQALLDFLADEDHWYALRQLSLDHDLGDDATGYDVVKRIVAYVVEEGRICPFQITVHSQNPVGRTLMAQTLRTHGIGQPDCVRVVDGILNTHTAQQCEGRHCCVHNPSDHPMLRWPMNWRGDRALMERICPHGIGHPDPDHLDFVQLTYGLHTAYDEGVHGCDGCCGTR